MANTGSENFKGGRGGSKGSKIKSTTKARQRAATFQQWHPGMDTPF